MISRFTYGGRVAYVIAAWLLVAGVIATVFMAGVSIFVSSTLWLRHMDFGYNTGLFVLVLPFLGLLARLPRNHVRLLALLLGLLILQSLLPLLRGSVPVIAALHPVNAMLVFAVAVVHARRSAVLLRPAPGMQTQTRAA